LSLALRGRLRIMGLKPLLVFGARRGEEGGAVDAHAWLALGEARIDAVGSSGEFRMFEG
jgi:hypothetical protein